MALPYINMNLPRACTSSPSWTLLPLSSPYHPSGSSQCTIPEHPVLCIKPGLAVRFTCDIIHISMPLSQIIPPSPSPTESKRLFYTSVSLLLSRIQGYHYHLSKFCIYVLVCEEIQTIHSEGDQPWDFFGRNDAKAETPVLWPPHAKSWLIGKDSDAARDWGQEEKGMTEDEMVEWHHQLDGRESEWTPGVGDGQGGLACCNSLGRKEPDTTERLNWTELNWIGTVLVFFFLTYFTLYNRLQFHPPH